MTGPARYASWAAIAAAVKAVASQNAKAGGPDLNTQIATARVDRFLCRVFADGAESQWLLKGGTSMLARVPRSRATNDVDLAAPSGSLEEAVDALTRCAQRDLGDHLTFELTASRVTGAGDNQPGVQTRRLVFTCRDRATGRRVGDVPVDVVVGPAPVGQVETIEPANRLHLPRPLPAYPYRLFPVVDQVADKVCATMATNYPGGKPSSRVKDLVDLVVITRTQQLDLDQLRAAITTKRVLSNMEPFEAFRIPDGWERRYRDLAGQTHATGGLLDVVEAEALVRQLVDSALAPAGGPAAVWVPGAGWTDPVDVSEVQAAVTAAEETGGGVHVRNHTRSGWPVREHWRAARGTADTGTEDPA